uniref:Alternative protein CAMKV n=1 Tax=Homo sapiens TaxID=9606 RepID=L8E961_HUMAN|nr:alternative protein CAMKV [Homo sapiens]
MAITHNLIWRFALYRGRFSAQFNNEMKRNSLFLQLTSIRGPGASEPH